MDTNAKMGFGAIEMISKKRCEVAEEASQLLEKVVLTLLAKPLSELPKLISEIEKYLEKEKTGVK